MLKSQHSLTRLVISFSLVWGCSALLPAWSAEPTLTEVETAAHQSNQSLLTQLPAEVKPFYLITLTSLYNANGMKPMWQDASAVQQFQQQLAELAISGVQPQFMQWVKWLSDPAITGITRDVVLSDAMLGYLQFVSGVKENGDNWLYGKVPYKMTLPPSAAIEQWQAALTQNALASYIATLAPQHPQYAKMHQALRTLLADTHPWPQLAASESLRPGQSSIDMPALREILARTASFTSTVDTPAPEVKVPANATSVSDDLSVDETAPQEKSSAAQKTAVVAAKESNRYTSDLVAGVKRFQKWHGLTDDGVIGKRTLEWLNVSSQTRATLLALNIQRLRILPTSVDTGIMVNIPNYSLIYYLNGNEVLSSRVIVGRPSRKTPLMSSELNNVVVNPPWNVPTKLIREDIVPKARANASYFAQHGYTVLSGWNNDASVIDPAMIDWSVVSPNNFPYRLRQAPGVSNSLGRYKFNMPSSEAIYLHDTPDHKLFQKDIRALSSGCVRVNKASDLAGMLLQDAGWSGAKVSSKLKQGDTTYVPIRHRIPVQLYYLTAWVADDGKPQFRTDIYNYDKNVRSGAQILSQAEFLLQ